MFPDLIDQLIKHLKLREREMILAKKSQNVGFLNFAKGLQKTPHKGPENFAVS